MTRSREKNNVTVQATKAITNEDSYWEGLLGKCINSIDSDEFHGNLVEALRALVDIDYSVVFAYRNEDQPVCLGDTYSPEQRVIFVDDYIKGPYLLDPFFKACRKKFDTGLYRLQDIAPDRFLQSEYYRSYYNRTDLSEEVCYIFYLPSGPAAVISLMRSKKNPRFSAREFKLLDKVSPIVINLAQLQWKDAAGYFEPVSGAEQIEDDHSLIEKSVGELFGDRITPRETQVIAQVLEGHSSESIANSLGISTGTVRIHRRNIYAKLQISSQQELFAIFFKKLTRVHG